MVIVHIILYYTGWCNHRGERDYIVIVYGIRGGARRGDKKIKSLGIKSSIDRKKICATDRRR